MKKQHRSQGSMDSCVDFTRVFEEYLNTHFDRIELNKAQPEHLDAFLEWGKGKINLMNSHLWAISRYYEYTGNDTMRRYAHQIRNQKIEKRRLKRPSLLLREIEGVKSKHIDALEIVGITNLFVQLRPTFQAHLAPICIFQLARLARCAPRFRLLEGKAFAMHPGPSLLVRIVRRGCAIQHPVTAQTRHNPTP
jgi:hypothetical protein